MMQDPNCGDYPYISEHQSSGKTVVNPWQEERNGELAST